MSNPFEDATKRWQNAIECVREAEVTLQQARSAETRAHTVLNDALKEELEAFRILSKLRGRDAIKIEEKPA